MKLSKTNWLKKERKRGYTGSTRISNQRETCKYIPGLVKKTVSWMLRDLKFKVRLAQTAGIS